MILIWIRNWSNDFSLAMFRYRTVFWRVGNATSSETVIVVTRDNPSTAPRWEQTGRRSVFASPPILRKVVHLSEINYVNLPVIHLNVDCLLVKPVTLSSVSLGLKSSNKWLGNTQQPVPLCHGFVLLSWVLFLKFRRHIRVANFGWPKHTVVFNR